MPERGPRAWLAVAFALAAVAFLGDWLTGAEISFSPFYLVGIGVGTWFAGRRAGVALSLASTAGWVGAYLLTGERYSRPSILYWNVGVEVTIFFAVMVALDRVRSGIEQERILRDRLESAYRRLDQEMRKVGELQQSLLPSADTWVPRRPPTTGRSCSSTGTRGLPARGRESSFARSRWHSLKEALMSRSPGPDPASPGAQARRRFLKTVGLAGLSSALAPAALSFAQSSAPPPADSTSAAARGPATPPAATPPEPPSEDAWALAAIIRRRYGKQLSVEQIDSIAKDFDGDLKAGKRLHEVKLENGDEPDFTFHA